MGLDVPKNEGGYKSAKGLRFWKVQKIFNQDKELRQEKSFNFQLFGLVFLGLIVFPKFELKKLN